MYTRAWTDVVLGSNPAKNIDDLMGNLRQDVNERLTDILGITSFTADPLVLTSLKLNRTANAKILGGTTNFSIRNSADTQDNMLINDATGNVTFRSTVTAVVFTGSHTVPYGYTLTLVDSGGNGYVVLVGPVDSGGSGYRLLRIGNGWLP